MPSCRVDWPTAWRVTSSRYPPIRLFEDVGLNPAEWDALISTERLINPDARQAVGDITLVAAKERVHGPGASYVMASFTHPNPKGSRFSDGSFGVYYAAATLHTAILETVFHFEAFARDSNDPARAEEMRVLIGAVDEDFEDASTLDDTQLSAVLDPHSYAASQPYAERLRLAGSNGIAYPSVRHAAGLCLGAFRPRAVGIPRQERRLRYNWNSQRVDRYFDYIFETWTDL